MTRKLFCNLLRSLGRVPEEDLEEIRKTKQEERHYIRLSGGGDGDMEKGLPDEYFEDDDARLDYDLDKVLEEQEREERKHERFQNFCFFSFLFFAVSVIVGLLALVGKLIHFLFIRRFVKDLDW